MEWRGEHDRAEGGDELPLAALKLLAACENQSERMEKSFTRFSENKGETESGEQKENAASSPVLLRFLCGARSVPSHSAQRLGQEPLRASLCSIRVEDREKTRAAFSSPSRRRRILCSSRPSTTTSRASSMAAGRPSQVQNPPPLAPGPQTGDGDDVRGKRVNKKNERWRESFAGGNESFGFFSFSVSPPLFDSADARPQNLSSPPFSTQLTTRQQ
jgi:hypothetical protein